MKNRLSDKQVNIAIILAVIVIIVLGMSILKKPSITGLAVINNAATGFATIDKEATHSDELGLVVDEDKNITWNLENPGDLKSIKASGALNKEGSAKIYIQKGDEKVLIFDSTKVIFDVNVEVLPDYKKIFQGDELLIEITLFNLRGFGSANVSVKYSIKDARGSLVAAEEENVYVETQAKFVRKLIIPSDLKSGTYTSFVEVRTPDNVIGTSSDSFEVRAKYEKEYPLWIRYFVIGLIGVFVLIVIVIFSLRLIRRLKKKRRVMKIKEEIPNEEIQKLENELNALKGARKSKLISEESYKNDKERIEKRLRRLK